MIASAGLTESGDVDSSLCTPNKYEESMVRAGRGLPIMSFPSLTGFRGSTCDSTGHKKSEPKRVSYF